MPISNPTPLFTPQEMARFAAIAGQAKRQAFAVPFLWGSAVLSAALMGFIFYIEWHIAYQIFDYLSGDEGYWPAGTLAFTGVLMIIGFHVLAERAPSSIAVRCVSMIASVLTPLYALGLGLLVTAILFSDGLGGMLDSPDAFTLSEVGDALKQSWLDWAFAHITNPIGIMVFALAAGGLAIVNLYIAHHMLRDARQSGHAAVKRARYFRDTRRDYAIIKSAQKEHQSIALERQTIARITPEDLAMEIAVQVHSAMQEALTVHKCMLKEIEYGAAPERFKPMAAPPPNPKQLAKDIQAIDAIGLNEILAAFYTPNTRSIDDE